MQRMDIAAVSSIGSKGEMLIGRLQTGHSFMFALLARYKCHATCLLFGYIPPHALGTLYMQASKEEGAD